jgi:hypothetical protein
MQITPRQLGSGVACFAWEFLWRVVALYGGATLAFSGTVYKWLRGETQELPMTSPWIAIVILILAAFWVWYNEHDKVRGKSRRQLLTGIIDDISNTTNTSVSIWRLESGKTHTQLELITALIKRSEDFGSDRDVELICKELNGRGLSGDPFAFYEMKYGIGSFKRKRLKFLQDARTSLFPIGNDFDAIHFLEQDWAEANGLKPLKFNRSDIFPPSDESTPPSSTSDTEASPPSQAS